MRSNPRNRKGSYTTKETSMSKWATTANIKSGAPNGNGRKNSACNHWRSSSTYFCRACFIFTKIRQTEVFSRVGIANTTFGCVPKFGFQTDQNNIHWVGRGHSFVRKGRSRSDAPDMMRFFSGKIIYLINILLAIVMADAPDLAWSCWHKWV